MEIPEENKMCQLHCIPNYYEGYAEIPPESLKRKLRLFLRRSLNVRQVRMIKIKTTHYLERLSKYIRRDQNTADAEISTVASSLKDGDLVRVRSLEEIQSTLNPWGILKGCMFMSLEMSPYCGTTQRVFKVLERFVDERDYHVKKSHGVVLLEGLYCEGTSDYGRCDRSCFYFWREEWLEKIDEEDGVIDILEQY
jgi:hypothetical protein